MGYKDWPWVTVYDAADGREIARLEVGTGRHMVIDWHPDGRHLAVGSTALGIQIWDMHTKRRAATLERPTNEIDFLSFHPSGEWLASWSWDGVISLWDPATGRQAMQIPLAANVRFSSDGRWLGDFWSSEDQAQLLEFVAPSEYFTLPLYTGGGRPELHACAVSSDDRLLTVAMDDGVWLWDLPNHREIAFLPCGLTEAVAFEADGAALWTCGEASGLQRWNLRPGSTDGLEWMLGPPQRIELPVSPTRMAINHGGGTMAVVSEPGGQAMMVDLATRSTRGDPILHPMAGYVALSSDTKWLAISGWHSDRAQLWDLENGKPIKDWIVGMQTRVAFTPDSRELIVSRGSEFSFLKVDPLKSIRRNRREIGLLAGAVAFSPDGRMMAMEMAPAVIHLKEVSTGRTLAQLKDPYGDRSTMLAFTHDGTKLMVLSAYASAIHVWDLRAVRTRLKMMSLDWKWTEFPQSPAVTSFPDKRQLLRIHVVAARSAPTATKP